MCGIGVPFIELGKEKRNEISNHKSIVFKVNVIIVLEHKHGGSLGIGKHSKKYRRIFNLTQGATYDYG